jgi:hypothetical protein
MAFLHARVVELAKHVVISLAPATLRVGLVAEAAENGQQLRVVDAMVPESGFAEAGADHWGRPVR